MNPCARIREMQMLKGAEIGMRKHAAMSWACMYSVEMKLGSVKAENLY